MEDWTWWKHGVVYQIYPRSFYDASGDGIGDIQGVIQKIDHLSDLGVDAVWLSPINLSPMHDFGYDVCDYRSIDPVFGTHDDFAALIREAHSRNIRIIMDMPLNHTSYLHPWFIESSSSSDNPKRDWYIWHDGVEGKPPNNWRSAFWGSAWEWHGETGQYYLHSFLTEQPDVNWRDEKLKRTMFDEIRFWLDFGVDGFRLDVVNWFVKDARFRSNPFALNPFNNKAAKYSRNRPETHDIMRELRRLADGYVDTMLVGEVFSYPPGEPELSAGFLGNGHDELHLAFDFSLLYHKWNARGFYRCIKRWYAAIPDAGWPCHVLSNHDQPRSINRYKNDSDSEKRARVAAMLLLTLRGTPFIYYGEEIGMKNWRIPRDKIADPAGRRFWPLYLGRDCARTPMQWTDGPNAGFSSVGSWLPVNMDYKKVNVQKQEEDRYSLLHFYKNLIGARKKHPSLMFGSWKPISKGLNGLLAYIREYEGSTCCVILNFTDGNQVLNAGNRGQWKTVVSTHRGANEHFIDLHFTVRPYEATVIEKIGDLK
jgi:alpha-glucosidase